MPECLGTDFMKLKSLFGLTTILSMCLDVRFLVRFVSGVRFLKKTGPDRTPFGRNRLNSDAFSDAFRTQPGKLF